MRKLIRLAGMTLAAAIGLVLIAVSAGILAERVSGRDFLAEAVSSLISGPSTTVAIRHIGLALPETLTLDGIAVRDSTGEWVRVDRVSLTIELLRLLTGRLDISRLDIGTIDVERMAEGGGGASFRPPLPITVQSLAIARLQLEKPVAGEQLAIAAAGNVRFSPERIAVDVTAQRRDGPPGRLAVDLDYDKPAQRLAAKVELDEPTGVALERLIGRRAPLQASLSGDGPLADWHGRLEAQAGDLAHLAAALAIAPKGGGYLLAASGTVAAQKIIPDPYAGLVGDASRFELRVDSGAASRIALDRLHVELAAGELTAEGIFGTEDETISGSADVGVRDLAPFAVLAQAPLGGSGTAHLDLSGSLSRPVAKIALDLTGASFDGNRAGRATGEATLVPLDDATSPNARFKLSGGGRFEGLTLASRRLPPGFGDALDWRIEATGDRSGERVEIASFSLADGGVALDAAATIASGKAEGEATLAIPDPSRFSLPLSGSTRLATAFSAEPAAGTATARISGTIDELAVHPQLLGQLLGRHAELAATVRRERDGRLTVDGLDLSGASARLASTAELAPDLDRLAAQVTLDVPDLAAVGPLGGEALSGRLSASGKFAGPVAAPQLAARLEIAKLSVGARRLDRIEADVAIANLLEPAGHIGGTFGANGLSGALRTDFTFRPAADTIALSGLQLDAAGAKLGGSLEVALASGLASGAVTGTIPDLAPFSGLAGTALAGGVDLKATLGTKSGQTAEFSLTARSLAVGKPGAGPVAISRFAASGRFTDLLGRPGGRADLSLSGATLAGGALEKTNLRLASSEPGRFRFDADLNGNFTAPLVVAAAGEARFGGASAQLRLTRLDGTYAGAKLALRQPLRISRDAGAVSFADLALAIGPGSLTGAGALGSEAISLALHGADLPIGLGARLAGFQEVTGRLGLDANIGGTVAMPRGTVVVTGSGLHFAAASQPGLPALAASARADWQGGRVDVHGRIDAPRHAAIGFAGSSPLELRRPFAFAVPAQGRLALKLEGDGDLADIADLLPIGEDRISGRFVVDVDVAGTVGSPTAGGRLTLAAGHYENMTSGTVLSDINLELDGDAERFVLRRFSATDGGTGRLSGQGSIVLTASPGPAIDLRADLQRFRLVRLDEADATAGGTVQLAGTVEAPRLLADLTVDNAEIRVPDRLPSSTPKLDVIRINSASGRVVASPGDATAAARLPIALELRINAPGQVFVRGRGLDAEWRGNLTIAGTSAAPEIAGMLQIVRGTFSLLGKDFSLTRGTITFPAGPRPDPLLDIVAEASSTDVTAQVMIRGTASAPTVTLTSQPPLPQDEVLSRLLFGTSVSQITPVQGLQLAQAAASLAGGGGPDLLGTVRRELGLDRLSIGSGNAFGPTPGSAPGLVATTPQSQQSQSGALGGTTVSAGKYIVPGFYVGVEQGVSGTGSAVRVEGEITPNLSISAQAGGPGSQGGQSIGINLKRDY